MKLRHNLCFDEDGRSVIREGMMYRGSQVFLIQRDSILVPPDLEVEFPQGESVQCRRLEALDPIVLNANNEIVSNFKTYILAISWDVEWVYCIRAKSKISFREIFAKHEHEFLSSAHTG